MESVMSMSPDDPRRFGDGPQAGDGVEKTATEASQGAKTGYMRWVLVISLVLVVVALGGAWLVYSGSHPHPQPPPAAQAAATLPLSLG
jgi:hypothetical protein